MALSSWFGRSRSKKSKKADEHQKEELLGVTQQLIDHVKTFSLDTFRNFPLQDEEEGSYDVEAATTSGSVRKDLSDWQEQHAFLVLSRVKELANLRFKLCPRYLKEQQFWRIYFMLVKSHVAEHELRAIRLAKLKSMATEIQKTPGSSAYEVEMAETKPAANLAPSTLGSFDSSWRGLKIRAAELSDLDIEGTKKLVKGQLAMLNLGNVNLS